MQCHGDGLLRRLDGTWACSATRGQFAGERFVSDCLAEGASKSRIVKDSSHVRRSLAVFLIGLLLSATSVRSAPATSPGVGPLRFEVSLPARLSDPEITGRLFLFVAKSSQPEPRLTNASLFGVDVKAARAGQVITLDGRVAGAPEATLGELAPGDYFVQALFNRYTEFRRADGHTIWAHNDQWEGQNFARSPGNLFSETRPIHVTGGADGVVKLAVDQVIPPVEIPPDSAWVQRIKFESPRLSKFWGRPMYLGATVLLPKGYAQHPEVRYPVVYIQGHFGLGPPFGFSATPDQTGRKSWARQREEAAQKHLPPPLPPPGTVQVGSLPNTETGHEFYEAWIGENFPRVIAVTFQHPTPYFDDSYGVNSPNCGPYGDAIMQELIPALESRYRMIQQSYARVLTGNSTGGWGSLAMQIYYPESFGGVWATSPDPVDFRLYYGGVNIYEDDNAFVEKQGPGLEGGGLANRRGSQRAAILGMQDGRWEWWKHTPSGPDGYPLPVWDLATGKIDHAVAERMREDNFDLRAYLARNWARIGSQLVDKLHVCAADTDAYYSHLAVKLLDEFMRSTRDPHVAGEFHYGPPGSHHGWTPISNAELVRTMAKHIAEHAPAGADNEAWRHR